MHPRGLQLLRTFLRESVNISFGLNRYVTMNALGDLHTGPRPGVTQEHDGGHDVGPQVDVTTRLMDAIIGENDGPPATPAHGVHEARRYRGKQPWDRIEYDERFREIAPEELKARVSGMFVEMSKERDHDRKQDLYDAAYETIYRYVDDVEDRRRALRKDLRTSDDEFSRRRYDQLVTKELSDVFDWLDEPDPEPTLPSNVIPLGKKKGRD